MTARRPRCARPAGGRDASTAAAALGRLRPQDRLRPARPPRGEQSGSAAFASEAPCDHPAAPRLPRAFASFRLLPSNRGSSQDFIPPRTVPRRLLPRGAIATALLGAFAAAASAVLPPEVDAALARARIPRSVFAAVVHDVDAAAPVLAWQPALALNPASLAKLLTTAAALDRLGPGWSWRTPVWLAGPVVDPGDGGVLDGDLVIKGSGDPSLVIERVWLLLRRVRELGVRQVRGDIVLDRSGFARTVSAPADFDGEPLRPYNVAADALLLNHKALQLTLTPDPAAGVARAPIEPRLAGVHVDAAVPLAAGACGDWRSALGLDFADALALRLHGSYAADCGVRRWPLAYPDAETYNHRLIAALWAEGGGSVGGVVRDGVAPAYPPSFEWVSPPLADIVRDINRHSNNVMAQQLFLTLGLVAEGAATPEAARAALHRWAVERLGAEVDGLVLDNGSGLSRHSRASARLLARLLLTQWRSPALPPLVASLPATGMDGTLRRVALPPGRAWLKTGSLRDVAGVAGYVLTDAGRWRIVVGIINHEPLGGARAALDVLVRWAIESDAAQGRPR